MLDLQPCSRCHRHVVARETACPFCAAPIAGVSAPRRPVLGRASRAVVFAAGATLVAAACGGKAKPADEMGEPRHHHGGGGCAPPDPQRVEQLEERRKQATTDDEKRALDEQLAIARAPVCMPYGAPPARRRVV